MNYCKSDNRLGIELEVEKRQGHLPCLRLPPFLLLQQLDTTDEEADTNHLSNLHSGRLIDLGHTSISKPAI